jgi:putative methyltransferase (TIGR04325 family)
MVSRAKVQRLADRVLPPGLSRRLKGIAPTYGFSGDYASWDEARRASSGYDAAGVLEKVRASALKVKNGDAWAERDSVLLPEGDYPYPLLAALLRAAVRDSLGLSVLDFGGSLGSSYFQCRRFLPALRSLEWSVVEQPSYVACGRRELANGELAFFDDVDACLEVRRPNVLLLSSVLPYVEAPRALLETLVQRAFPTIIVDKTPFGAGTRDRLMVQKPLPDIYEGSYPAWILGKERFLAFMRERYDCLAEFVALQDWMFDAVGAPCLGFVFERRTSPLP